MQPAERPEGLVVATPERVAFEYALAGLGSRFMAHAIDLFLLAIVFLALSTLPLLLGSLLRDGRLALLVWIISAFALFVLYFPILEGAWNGQTLGKRIMRIRVLGERGEPVTAPQVAIRNLVRLVDFLPLFYGVGIVTLFIQGGSKRLGDFAAGTVVVRDGERIRLRDLARATTPAPEPATSAAATSIWADEGSEGEPTPPPLSSPVARSLDAYEEAVNRMPDGLRRFVVAYARRREDVVPARREQLAQQVASTLAGLLPAEVASYGAVAVLDGLAGLIYAPDPAASSTSGLPPPSPGRPPSRLPPAV